MALRVLLADESSTIKKVIQLSLHDFGVDIKAVGNGLDVLSTILNYQPDLVFVDVLLSKKSGYEVIREVKTNPDTSHIPVVLMWSGFMQLDEAKATSSKADGRLEKPFDSDQLRDLVQKLVGKTKTNPVSQYLVFPQMPEFQEMQTEGQSKGANASAQNAGKSHSKEQEAWSQQSLSQKSSDTQDTDFGMHRLKQTPSPTKLGSQTESHDEFEEFSFDDLNLPKLPSAQSSPPPQQPMQTSQQMHSFQQAETHSDSQVVMPSTSPSTQIKSPQNHQAPPRESIVIKTPEIPSQNQQPSAATSAQQNIQQTTVSPSPAQAVLPSISEEKLEAIIREEVRSILTRLCTKMVPELAERAVKEEIQKILSSPTTNV